MGKTISATLRVLALTASAAALAACTTTGLDWDLRGPGRGDTSEAAARATRNRPEPDARGVLSYPGYQVALARRGDTVASVAGRLGIDAGSLARANALRPEDPLRQGEILALPTRVAAAPAGSGGQSGVLVGAGAPPAPVATGPIEVTTLAGAAIDRAEGSAAATAPAARTPGAEPVRHKVVRGETAYTVARAYNVSARALADWNGLGPDMALREGQTLLIPTAADSPAPAPEPVTEPGEGSPTPLPPSAAKPLPDENPVAASKPAPGTPPSPDLGSGRTAASSAQLAMPVEGSIVRGFDKAKNAGIDIAASPGSGVRAAAEGTVAAVTKNTDQVPVIVIRHPGNLMTVYMGIDGLKVAKGDKVSRGQQIAVVRKADRAIVHFEVRKGVDAVDPMGYLQ